MKLRLSISFLFLFPFSFPTHANPVTIKQQIHSPKSSFYKSDVSSESETASEDATSPLPTDNEEDFVVGAFAENSDEDSDTEVTQPLSLSRQDEKQDMPSAPMCPAYFSPHIKDVLITDQRTIQHFIKEYGRLLYSHTAQNIMPEDCHSEKDASRYFCLINEVPLAYAQEQELGTPKAPYNQRYLATILHSHEIHKDPYEQEASDNKKQIAQRLLDAAQKYTATE